MKRFEEKIAFIISLIIKTPGNILSWIVCKKMPVVPGRVMCWAYNFKQFGCNPRYLTDYILENNKDLEIYWVFRKGIDISQVDKRIKVVRFRSWEYLKLLATAEFFVTNSRTFPFHIYWHKRQEQKYLMLWHGGVALKKIEKDAEEKLGYQYVHKAKIDSKIADLMISGCRMQTNLLRSSFWYDGPILEHGIPRNDIFFQKEKHSIFRKRITSFYNIDPESRIVLYAPTFRHNKSIKPYSINWTLLREALKHMLECEKITIIVRLHPNLINKVDTTPLIAYENVVDGTKYHDMQELLCVADFLITDYSSSMFDFAMLHRPCFLYASDIKEYDRGYYFKFNELPFPIAENTHQLLQLIREFNQETYDTKVNDFLQNTIGLTENGRASESITNWMLKHYISHSSHNR